MYTHPAESHTCLKVYAESFFLFNPKMILVTLQYYNIEFRLWEKAIIAPVDWRIFPVLVCSLYPDVWVKLITPLHLHHDQPPPVFATSAYSIELVYNYI